MRNVVQPKRLLLLVLLLAIALGLVILATRRGASSPEFQKPANLSDREVTSLAKELGALKEREKQIAETIWKPELQAEECGIVFESLWDSVNRATNKFGVVASLGFRDLAVPTFSIPTQLPHGVQVFSPTAQSRQWNPTDWKNFLRSIEAGGWNISSLEFRHNRFATNNAGLPESSVFHLIAHLNNEREISRATIEGDLQVLWQPSARPPSIEAIDASRLSLRTLKGAPAFQAAGVERIDPIEGSHFIDPLILYDLDGDGLSEIILAARNLVMRRGADGSYTSEPLCRESPGLIFTAVIADFDGDGMADFLCSKFEGLVLFKGSSHGTFDTPGQPVWRADPKLKYGQVLTCGDIDGDGDLDVWLAQYKVPYERGQMPTPYFDANDGHPSYLLINDGTGRFTDATADAGLARKRWRRTYSASLADVDRDGDLDLIVVSDFAGVDLYLNDGRGHFTEETSQWMQESKGFGMAHVWADLDGDSNLDLLMIGMNSPTAERLESLTLKRPGFESYDLVRGKMTHGNRLHLGVAGKKGFHEGSLGTSLSRTGWSWGCSAFDYDNDGHLDLYVANGHVSRQSVHDHEPEFWKHDIYMANSRDSVVGYAYTGGKFMESRDRGYSYGGYEKNRLFWNHSGASFVEVGHLNGVALEEDSRNVVADDLDGDGRQDLLVTTFEEWPERQQTLRVFKNETPNPGNWIGVKFREEGNGTSPVGAKVMLRYSGGVQVRDIITGDSYRSQNANTVHFGLGSSTHVENVEVRWLNGRTRTIQNPEINRYHVVRSVP